jgi:hypothetical protein
MSFGFCVSSPSHYPARDIPAEPLFLFYYYLLFGEKDTAIHLLPKAERGLKLGRALMFFPLGFLQMDHRFL